MKYRVNRRTGDRISEIGMGTAYLPEAGMEEGVRTLKKAYETGINYFDLAAGDGDAFPIFGEALADVRENIFYQIHFGADYTKKTYGWSLDLETIKKSVAWQLKQLKTDYIDYGFIHCQDEFSDWETYQKNGVLDYLLRLKKEGVVRHIGLSSHTPKVIMKILDTGLVDMLMFSVNAAYDCGEGEYAYGENDERQEVYKRCEKEGIGITVMKPFSGGQLLDAKTSPFGKALTPYQCIKYCLDRPGILTVLPGAQSVKEIETRQLIMTRRKKTWITQPLPQELPSRLPENVFTAITANPVLSVWISVSSTNTMIFPKPVMHLRQSITVHWKRQLQTASDAVTVMLDVPSMSDRVNGCRRSENTLKHCKKDNRFY